MKKFLKTAAVCFLNQTTDAALAASSDFVQEYRPQARLEPDAGVDPSQLAAFLLVPYT